MVLNANRRAFPKQSLNVPGDVLSPFQILIRDPPAILTLKLSSHFIFSSVYFIVCAY
jgi:hypothetical protein